MLKARDEFDNKIFILTSDHGHTAMPEFGLQALPDGRVVEPDTSCKLNLKDFGDIDIQDSEKYNNNLHIWELARLFQQFGSTEGLKLLVPKEIELSIAKEAQDQSQSSAVTSDVRKANVIAALNGPMAHIYVKAGNDWSQPNGDHVMLGKVAKILEKLLKYGNTLKKEEKDLLSKKLLNSLDFVLVRIEENYKVFNGINVDTDGNITGLANPAPLAELEGNPDYVDAVKRIENMNDLNRSGDIVLLMKYDVTIPSGESIDVHRYTTGVSCKSWHGSLNMSDSYVPMIVAYPGGNSSELNSTVNAVCPDGMCEGNWKVPHIVKHFLENQYPGQAAQ